MNSGSPMDGLVVNYDDMIPTPAITNNPTNNTLVFNNPVQTTAGRASPESETLEFNSPTLFKHSVLVGFNQRKHVRLCSNAITI